MTRTLPLIGLFGLAACNMQSPAPVMTATELEDYRHCKNIIPDGDVVSSGYADPLKTCMEWRKAGWGRGKQ